MDKIDILLLIDRAIEASENSHSPYSHFKVGAALKTKTGNIYTGCNIENASFGLTICAERVAIFKAMSEGERDFTAIAVYADTGDNLLSPCGACRQIISEFCPNAEVIMCNRKKEYKIMTPAALLPFSFGDSDFDH
ncbi:MAG: cytidine deaminase [Planctomycetes bacterium]|nr:cytidine deaminase [Planctomycetota bacterium]